MAGSGCAHLENYKSSAGVKPYKVLHAIFVVGGTSQAAKTKLRSGYCHLCKKSGPFLHACLHCIFMGCHKHIREHTENKTKHCLAMDLNYGQIHCSQCKDYVYDKEIDSVASENTLAAGKFRMSLFSWTSWTANDVEKELLEKHSTKIKTSPESTVGLRGLLNLGSTCFMNCVIQALTHTPLLRDYFFTDKHQCKNGPNPCLVSKLFQEFYNGEKSPLALHEFLHHIWTRAKHLAGYEQQDAHEFFIATLDVLHQHFEESMPAPQNKEKLMLQCTCIIDQIFTGRLQSDVVCQQCNGVSTTIDPIFDFSLDLGSVSMGGQPPTSLVECLERFTRAEHLGSCAKIECSNCRSPQESTKQLTVKTLPVVVTFHFKRFQHLREKEKKIKISSFISFPEILDMTPFTSQAKSSVPLIPPDNRYSLFAVINHVGNSVNAGHYICFVRQQHDFWYKCDDQCITRASLTDVLNSEAYLLFYHKHILAYD